MHLSIVIPAFNEARKIGADVSAAAEFLVARGLSGEIIVVDDGSTDDTAGVARDAIVPAGVRRLVIRLPANKGKGAAVREGILSSAGDYVLFADCGMCVPFEQSLRGIQMIRSGRCDIAHGSRKLPASRIVLPQSLSRRLLSRVFRLAVGLLMPIGRGLSDTQCGFKVYRGDVARLLYGQCVIDGFMFDIEVLVRARAMGYRVAEFPITWICDRDSRLHPGRTAMNVVRELTRIWRSEML